MIPIKDMVENPHWIYKRYRPFWDFLLQSFEGGIEYTNSSISNSSQVSFWGTLFKFFAGGVEQKPSVSGNLFQHPKELNEDYNRRMSMSYYYNFCAPIIDIYSNHLFRKPIIEDFGNLQQTMDDIGEDIDQMGSSLHEFRRELSKKAQVYGHVYVIVDSPSISTSDVITRKDQIEKRAFPYLTIHAPQSVINWALDEFGFPYWVLIRECYDENGDPMTYDKNKTGKVLYRLWTRMDWTLYDSEYNPIGVGVHGLGEVPIVCIYDKKSDKVRNFLGVSSLADIALIARDIYNSCSELRQILRDQTFAFLAVQGDSTEYSAIEIGTAKGLLYPEGRNVPQYVSPSAENAEVYFSHIDRQVTKIYQLAKLESGGLSGKVSTPSIGGDQQSGVSKAWDFNETNAALAMKASNMQDGELRILQLISKWQGQEFEGNVQYPEEFSVSDLKNDLDEIEQETKVQLGKSFNIQVRKDVIRKKYPRMPEEDINKMEKEIEELFSTEQGQSSGIADRVAAMFKETQTTATGGQKQGV